MHFRPLDFPDRPPSQDPYEVIVARWRSRLAARSSPPTRQILPAPPRLPRRLAILVLPSQPIPVGRPNYTHPNGVRSSSDHHSSDHSSSNHSPADHSSSGHSTSDQSLSRHSSPSLPLGMRPRLWLRSLVSSTCFSYTAENSPSNSPATTSDRHSHSPSHSARLYHKRCRSLTVIVPSSNPDSRDFSHTYAYLLPPCKRFKDSYSPEDSTEEDTDADVLADIKADDAAVEAAA
ncbi:hypothetical protein Tco_1571833, partial [Tanacetum coccineum]